MDKRNQNTKEDFKFLSSEGNYGFYKSCEITSIFLINNSDKKIYNYYMLINFDENDVIDKAKITNLTNSPFSIKTDLKLGICKYYLKVDEILDFFNTLVDKNEWLFNGQSVLFKNKLSLIPKQYIPTENNLCNVLKNNFINGSYIIELFDDEKLILKDLTYSEKEKINNEILKYLPINLNIIFDRVGNVIFQFPSNLISAKIHSSKEWDGVKLEIAWHHLLKEKKAINTIAEVELDGSIIGFGLSEENSSDLFVKTSNSEALMRTKIYNKENSIIYSTFSGTFTKGFNLNMGIGSQHSEPRTIIKDGKTVEIELYSYEHSFNKNQNVEKDYYQHILKRTRENEILELENRKEIKQFCKNGNEERENALLYIRDIINQYGVSSIYLWDPYIRYQDILDTLYYLKKTSIPMKVITSFGSDTKNIFEAEKGNDYLTFKNEQQHNFSSCSNNRGIDIEIRCKHDNYGWSFHDRFIIFPADDPFAFPHAWSLGTSINSAGKAGHHIIQKVPNSRIIQNAFDNLWDALNHSDCILWSKK